ncbi:MAG: GGDEF domain-containing protein [Proteobacteria bacterium]|nr:GGDEF domain-containing protein [Pseudomonadota bacterium]
MTAENITNRLTLDLKKFIWINTIVITTLASAIFLIYLDNPKLSALVLCMGILVGAANHFILFKFYRKRTETELNSTFERLHDELNFDELTNVYNRKAGSLRFREELERTTRTGEKLSIAMIDADNFKAINDTYGHLAGDEVLRVIASTIKSKLRTNDVLFRYGGEEFIIIMPNTSEHDASIPLERLREELYGQVIEFDDHRIQTSVSIGVTEVLNGREDESMLIGRADNALYKAKRTGKNKIVYHTATEGFNTASVMAN